MKKSSKMQYLEAKRKNNEKEIKKLQRKKNKKLKIILTASMIVLAAAVPLSVYSIINFSGLFGLNEKYSAQSDDFKITPSQMSYFVQQAYNTYKLNNLTSGTQTDIDENISLKKQYYNEENKITWFEYLMDNFVQPEVKRIILLNEGALEEGYTLSNEAAAQAEEIVKELDLNDYGRNVSEDEILKAVKMELLASEYDEHIYSTFSYTDEQIEGYYNEHLPDNTTCSYKYASFNFQNSTVSDEADIIFEESEAAELAEKASRCKSSEEFDSWLYEFYSEYYPDMNEKEKSDKISGSTKENYSCTKGNELSEWLYSSDTALYDTKTQISSDGYTVYMKLSEPQRKDDLTIDIRCICIANDSDKDISAVEIYNEWKNGDKSEEGFAKLAKKYSEDTSASENGGLYSEVYNGYLIAEINEWCFDDSRKSGDSEIFNLENGSYIVYYSGKKDEEWKVNSRKAMEKADYNDLYYAFDENYKVSFSESFKKVKA